MKQHKTRKSALFGFVSLGAFCIAAAPPGAAAQAGANAENNSSRDTVVVTARRREESIQDVPVSASAFSDERVEMEDIDNLRELIQLVPGASTADLGASFSNEIIIRGQGAGRAVNGETATGIYRNGIFIAGGNIGGRNFNRMDLFDVERIEVLRGPQGALFGRNAIGGAINLITKSPGDELEAMIEGAYGSNDRYEIEAMLNAPLTNQLSVRLGFLREDDDGGFYTDEVTGEALDAETLTGGRVGLRYSSTDDFDATLTVDYFEDTGPSFAVGVFNPTSGEDPFTTIHNTPTFFEREELTGILEFEKRFDFATLNTITLFKNRIANTSDDLDAFLELPSFLMLSRTSSDDFERFGQEVRLTSRDSGPWQWLVGMDFAAISGQFDSLTGATLSETMTDDITIAGYASLGYDITERLNITGEIRYTHDDKNFELFSVASGVTSDAAFDEQFNNLSPGASITYEASDDLTLYFRYATAFRSGGFNNIPDDAAVPRFTVAYNEEDATAYEAGVKASLFDGGLTANLAGFYSRTNDILVNNRVTSATNPGAFIDFLQNSGDAEQYGVELEATAIHEFEAIGGRLTVNFAGSRNEGEITSGLLEGFAIPYVREWQANVSSTYLQHLTSSIDLYINHSFRGEYGGFQSEQDGRTLDDIQLHDLNVGLRTDQWTLSASIENLTNAFYIPQKVQPTAVRAGEPRSFIVRISASL